MKPISIAFVDETGTKCFYAEFANTYRLEDCHPFTEQHVLPYLRKGEYEMNINDARNRLYDYFDSLNDTVKIWSDTQGWDEVVMNEIFPHYEGDIWPPRVHKQFGQMLYFGTDAVRFRKIQDDLFSEKKSSLRDKYVSWLMLDKKFYSGERTP
jgi:hypothetical protein